MRSVEKNNADLVWDLQAFKEQQRARDFVMGFENKLCVYSDSVEQLYSNYNIFFPKDEDHKLVILPNPYAHHDIFQGVTAAAVQRTGLNVIPGQMLGKRGVFLLIPFKGQGAKYRPVPLRVGMRAINERRPSNSPLLPILMKGDLRELQAKTPCLHLHCLNLSKLTNLSTLDRTSIKQVILDRLQQIG